MMKTSFVFVTVLSMVTMVLAGCAVPGAHSPTPLTAESTGILEIRVTDKPPEPNVTAINVELSNVEVHRAGDESDSEGQWIPVEMTEQPFEANLIELQISKIEEILTEDEVTTGHYTQIRMDVGIQSVDIDGVLVDDVEVVLPSGKLKIVGSFYIEEGQETVLTLDFLADKSLVVTGQGNKEGQEYKVLFKPVVHMKVFGPRHHAKLEGTLDVSEEAGEPTAIAELSSEVKHRGKDSVHLKTLGEEPGPGYEARIVIPLPAETTLGDIESISWWAYLDTGTVSGYIPHADLALDYDRDGIRDDVLVAEGAHQNDNSVTGWPTDMWIQTFDGASGNYTTYTGLTGGPSDLTSVNDETAVWMVAANDSNFGLDILANFKSETGKTDGTVIVNKGTPVLAIEIEVDNWVLQSEAYVDDIVIVIDGINYKVLVSLSD